MTDDDFRPERPWRWERWLDRNAEKVAFGALGLAAVVVVISWLILAPAEPDCRFQRTAGNWQQACR